MDRQELYASVTTEVVRQIEAGADPNRWRMPWAAIPEVGQPVNASTGVAYRGGNSLIFSLIAQSNGWSGHWATYRQWAAIGAQVRRGERGTRGVKWSVITKAAKTADNDTITSADGSRLVPFVFTVFNADQVDRWTAPVQTTRDTPERIQAAEAFFADIGADVRYGCNRAAYSPAGDYIVLPALEQFSSAVDFYATSSHEHGHWSGAPSRLARDLSGRFGTDAYAVEELVAELSAAFTCAHLGLSTTPRPDHALYLASWLRVLRADSSALFHAASKAQAATDFLVQRAGTTASLEAAA
jgi:antirestriction protein ArdC